MSQDRLPRVLHLVDRISGPALWRTLQPVAELERIGYQGVGWEFIGESTNEQREQLGLRPVPEATVQKVLAYASSGAVDAIVLPRLGYPVDQGQQMRAFLHTLKRAGNVLIYEADDDIFSPSIVKQHAAGLHRETDLETLEAWRMNRIDVLRRCDGATVSTQRLATVVRQFVPESFPIHVVPNFIDWQWWQRIKSVSQRWIPPLTIGWAGGGRPDADLADMAWAWGEVAKARPDVRFVVAGCRMDGEGAYRQPSIAATPWARQILDFVPEDRTVALPWFSITEYPLALLNMDIGCCPIADTPFNRCKTAVKWMEFTAAGAAVVASARPLNVYRSVMDGLPSNFLCSTREEWRDSLLELVNDAILRDLCVQEQEERVLREHTLEKNVLRWPAAWHSIVEQARVKQQRRILTAVN